MWCISLRIPARNDAKTLKIRMFCSAYKPLIPNTIQAPFGRSQNSAQQFAMDVEYSQDVVFDWGNLLLLLNEGTFKLIQ